ncbi:DUF3489 domain-containing protein [Roseovarius sp. MBR-6]|jgi:hypothetical protein|uniref:DUF3489 domain-containing protein n=1 Tax=Roseovarius sp. MBR-6 TaxID=3156459 RepID=UPI0033937A1A
MPKLTDTQSLILSAGAQRPGNIAMPLPRGLHGAAAKKVVSMMITRGWLAEVAADIRKGDPLWRETGDGHGTTLVVTDTGLLAIGIEPVVVKTMAAIRTHAARLPAPKQPSPRAGTKQAMLIALLQRPEGATMEVIIAATGWQAHTARGVMSGALGKKLRLVVTSVKEDERGRVYRIARPA